MKRFAADAGKSAKLPREADSLGALQREIVKIVYALKSATAEQVLKNLPQTRKNATVRTSLTRLTSKGLLRRVLSGRTYIYLPAMTRKDSANVALTEFAEIHFGGSLVRAAEEMLRLTGETSDTIESKQIN